MAQAQLQDSGKYLWQTDPSSVDDECKLYADTKYPHRDSLDHPIKHSGAMCIAFVPATVAFPFLVPGIYYSCKYWRSYRYQRKGHHKNWTEHYERCLKKKAVTLSAFDE